MTARGSDFFNDFGLSNVSAADAKNVREICRIVSTRSARLAGAAIAAVVSWMDENLEADHTIAIDGSLFEKYPGFQDDMAGLLRDLFGGRSSRIKLDLAKDGSGIGSAIIGAVAAMNRR
jgi:hexokinase